MSHVAKLQRKAMDPVRPYISIAVHEASINFLKDLKQALHEVDAYRRERLRERYMPSL